MKATYGSTNDKLIAKSEVRLKKCLDRYGGEDVVIVINGSPNHLTHFPNFGTCTTTAGWQDIDKSKWINEGGDNELASAILEASALWKKINKG